MSQFHNATASLYPICLKGVFNVLLNACFVLYIQLLLRLCLMPVFNYELWRVSVYRILLRISSCCVLFYYICFCDAFMLFMIWVWLVLNPIMHISHECLFFYVCIYQRIWFLILLLWGKIIKLPLIHSKWSVIYE